MTQVPLTLPASLSEALSALSDQCVVLGRHVKPGSALLRLMSPRVAALADIRTATAALDPLLTRAAQATAAAGWAQRIYQDVELTAPRSPARHDRAAETNAATKELLDALTAARESSRVVVEAIDRFHSGRRKLRENGASA